AGAAGSKHGISFQVAFFQSFQKFTALFHDGQVCAEIGIENIIKPDLPQSSYQSFNGCKLPGQAERLSPGSADCRSKLDHCDLFWICQGIQDPAAVISFP